MPISGLVDRSADNAGIQVYLRIRPASVENSPTYFQRDEIDLKRVSVKVPKNEESIVNNSRTSYNFWFSGILDDKATQREVFKIVGIPAIQNALAGYNSTIFAYGQTGSGKTFTVTGGPERYDDRGIIPRTISYLFQIMNEEKQKDVSYLCSITYLEIYNQSGYDLLVENKNDNKNSSYEDEAKRVFMLEDEYGNFHFKNLSMHLVSSEKDALNLLFQGETNRVIAATEMNQNSTRSHCIFTIVLEKRTIGADVVIRSKLNIVDLAGSERVSKTSSTGQTLQEAKYINSSLFFLEMVIVALQEKSDKKNENFHVPYRNSMMTSVLRDSLGGNCKTIMIANISPEVQHTDESISTCHFAQRVALIKNEASVNEKVDPELVIQRLQTEVCRLREELDFLNRKSDDNDLLDYNDAGQKYELSQNKIDKLTKSIQQYVQNPDTNSYLDFCGEITIPKIHATCSIFKDMLLHKSRMEIPANDIMPKNNDPDEEMSVTNQQCFTKNESSNQSKSGRSVSKKQKNEEQKITKQRYRNTNNVPKIVCGVPICLDQCVINEPNHAFEWFKERYSGLSSIEECKNMLKMKYSEAKKAGTKIEDIQVRIRHHKEALDQIKNKVDQSVPDGDNLLSLNEKYYHDAIDQEKVAYKDTLEMLSKMKGTIEGIQQKLKKSSLKLQSDFDTWYQEVTLISNEKNEWDTADESTTDMTSMICDRGKSSTDMTSMVCDRGKQSMEMRNSFATVIEAEDTHQISEELLVPQQIITSSENHQNEFKMPDGIKLTGNAEADADIIAFYKAKELLLSKMKRK